VAVITTKGEPNWVKDVKPEPKHLPESSLEEFPSRNSLWLPATRDAIRMSIDMTGWALAIVITVVVVFALQWAEKFFIPLLLGILIAYTLNPLVVWLERVKVPRLAGTSIVMLVVLSASAFVTVSAGGQIQAIFDQLPVGAAKVSLILRSLQDGQPNVMQKVQAAAHEIDKATSEAADIASNQKQPAKRSVIDQSTFKLSDFLLEGSMGIVGLISQSVIVLVLVFFLLLTGDMFKHKVVRMIGSSMSDKKITEQILEDINVAIQHYMFMLLMANILLAILTWVAFRWIGLDNAGGWAIAAGILNVVPYLGHAVIAVGAGMAGFMQFDSFWMALLVSGSSLAIAGFISMLVIPWMTGQIAKMNVLAIFISLLFWGWLWGIAGLLLAIPILCVVKVISQHVEELQPLAELLNT
jgi:predicted PurR-regulated permease PerM